MKDEKTTYSWVKEFNIEKHYNELFTILVEESDRGAVLLGVSYIDAQLKEMFTTLTPEGASSGRKREIFAINGPFGTLSSKLNTAYVCRILPHELVDAIFGLKQLRDKLAHKVEAFCLSDHIAQIRAIFAELGENLHVGVSHTATDWLLKNAIAKVAQMQDVIKNEDPELDAEGAALSYLNRNRDLLRNLEVHRAKWELGIGIVLICGMIQSNQNYLKSKFTGSEHLRHVLGKGEGGRP